MSADYRDDSRTARDSNAQESRDPNEVADRVASFLRRNFPQIAMHGGDAAVLDVDADTGTVRIRLSGACGDCGISPMTTRAIRARLPMELDAVTEVQVETA